MIGTAARGGERHAREMAVPLDGLKQLEQVVMPGMEKTQKGKERDDQSRNRQKGEHFIKHSQAFIFKDFSSGLNMRRYCVDCDFMIFFNTVCKLYLDYFT